MFEMCLSMYLQFSIFFLTSYIMVSFPASTPLFADTIMNGDYEKNALGAELLRKCARFAAYLFGNPKGTSTNCGGHIIRFDCLYGYDRLQSRITSLFR